MFLLRRELKRLKTLGQKEEQPKKNDPKEQK
jgi:hypothetical protein